MEDLNKLYKDLDHYDPHVRQNAVIGLGRYFEDETSRQKLSEEEKSNILTKILSRLEPSEGSIEVKARTVRILSQIAKFSKESEIEQIFKKVITYITMENAVGKDIYVTCIKTILGTAPASCCKLIGKAIIPELSKGILTSQNMETIDLCLDAFTDYINAFDYVLIKENDESLVKDKVKLVHNAIQYISSDNESLQNNAIRFIGAFSILLSRSQIGSTLKSLIQNLKSASTNKLLISYFNTITAMAKVSALKHIEFLQSIVPLTTQYANVKYAADNPADYDEKNELVQSCLSLQEAYLTKVADNLIEFIPDIASNSVQLMEYDPNYSYDTQMEGADEGDFEGYDDYDYEQVAAMDDSSWKARKGAVNVLQALVKSGISIDRSLKETIIKKLVSCLKEHDESTKFDIISTLGTYLSSMVIMNEEDKGSAVKIKRMSSMVNDVMPQIIKDIMTTVDSNLKSSNQNLITKTLELLPNVAMMAGNDVIAEFPTLKSSIDSVCFNASSPNTNNTILFYKFLSQLFNSTPDEEEYMDIMKDIMDYLKAGITHKFYLVAIESLKAANCLVPILANNIKTHSGNITSLYEMILPKFLANDVDNGLKVSSIAALAQIVICAGNALNPQKIFDLFGNIKEKMKNEALRSDLFSALIKMTNECKGIKLEQPLRQFESTIIEFLTQIVPFIIKLHTLNLLESIFKKYPMTFKGSEKKIVSALQQMKFEESFIPNIFNAYIAMIDLLSENDIDAIINTTVDKINQIDLIGTAVEPVFNFIQTAGRKVKPANLKKIVSTAQSNFENLNENSLKLVAILAGISKADSNLIDFCLQTLSNEKDAEIIKKASTLIGNSCLFSSQSHFELISKLEDLIKKANDAESKNILAVSIGKIGLSDPKKFTEKYLKVTPNKLNIYSMREFITQIADKNKPLNDNDNKSLFTWLNQNLSNSDKEFNDLCCECLGILSGFSKNLLPEYEKGFQGAQQRISSFYHGLRYVFKKRFGLQEHDLDILMGILIKGLQSNDLPIKLKAFQSLVTVSHNYSQIVKKYYDQLLAIFEEAHKINTAWIEIVDFGGGCKIKQDKGVDIRNAVYNTIKTFIEKFPTKVNIASTIKICIDGINDNTDIQNAVFACLLNIAKIKVSAFISFADNLCDSLKGYLDNIRSAEAKTEFCNNIKRLLDELQKEHDIADGPKFVNLYDEVKKKINP
ncbi:MAG: hypothetical protein MJ252_01410 [archaeon]|nr:hypothetical protein [archaeon]